MSIFEPLDFLCVNHVVLSVCSNETQPILAARAIENNASGDPAQLRRDTMQIHFPTRSL
jgi:hypothetical protein